MAEPPEPSWTVIYDAALIAWLRTIPALVSIEPVTAWMRQSELLGPPEDAVRVDPADDFYLAPVQGTGVLIRYVMVEYERLMIVREIG